MTRGERFQRFNAGARDWLEADVGPVDDPNTSCGTGACERDAAFRVPWPHFGGDVAFCEFHLARYRARHPDLFDRVQEAVDEDLTAYATRGDRFLTFDEIPEQLFDEEFVAIALLVTGRALYEEADPDETVEYVVVDRRLEEDSRTEVPREKAGEFLHDVEQRVGVHEWADDTAAALNGGEPA